MGQQGAERQGTERQGTERCGVGRHGDGVGGRTVWERTRTRTRAFARRIHNGDAETGMSTAEYAVGTIAAAGFAAVLYKIVNSGPVAEAMRGLIERALDAGL